ncbi:hypothetical protein IA539_18430 [Gordonia sp. zg691]|uniref:hypothetical protein n=1 Tax=Gordonia jinghuaiqii TaxID=2758710 RepID=UPI0016622A44|nr:hypothetical protein [Gordonia jinghuaiqii]MBD0863159.1 hypothetical protein [Gordonia jinghuaiqii]
MITDRTAALIRQRHNRSRSSALRKRRGDLARASHLQILGRNQEEELKHLIALLGTGPAPRTTSESTVRPASRKKGTNRRPSGARSGSKNPRHKLPAAKSGNPVVAASDAPSTSTTVPEAEDTSEQAAEQIPRAMPVSELAREVGLPTTYVAALARKHRAQLVHGEESVVSATVVEAIRAQHNLKRSKQMQKTLRRLKKQHATRDLDPSQQRRYNVLSSIFDPPGTTTPSNGRQATTVKKAPKKAPAPHKPKKSSPSSPQVAKRTCLLCGSDFYSTAATHGCALDRRVRRTGDLPPIRAVRSTRVRGTSAATKRVRLVEFDVTPRQRNGFIVPSGHPGSGRRA